MSNINHRPAQIAEMLIGMPGKSHSEIDTAILRRFPDAAGDEIARGAEIAVGMLEAEADIYEAEASAVRDELKRRGISL